MNLIYFEGNLVKEPTVKYLENGSVLTEALFAENQTNTKANYLNVVFFGEQAERFGNDYICGRQYKITGQLVMKKFVNKDGVKVRRYDMYASSVKKGYIPKKYKRNYTEQN